MSQFPSEPRGTQSREPSPVAPTPMNTTPVPTPPVTTAPATPVDRGSDSSAGSTKQTAKHEAAQTKDTAVDATKNVAATAKQEAGDVAAEVRDRASELGGQLMDEVRTQGHDQQQRLAGGLKTAAGELDQMASNAEGGGIATDLTRQVGRRLDRAATWLQDREPSDVLDEVRSFARRQPAVFLVGAGVAGLVVGRLARGIVASRSELDSPRSGARPQLEARPVQPAPMRESASLIESDTATPGSAAGISGVDGPAGSTTSWVESTRLDGPR